MAVPPPAVLTLGEALVDWVSLERGAGLGAAATFVKAPGGAPMNVAVGLARLGVEAGLVGCVAPDPFGAWLRALLTREGVDTRWLDTAPGTQTRMAYVVTNEAGDRELAAFSTEACADAALRADQVPTPVLDGVSALVFGSLILQGSPAREAVLGMATRVHANRGLVVFDPNIRPVLWPDPVLLALVLEQALAVTDVLKAGDDELPLMSGETDPLRGARVLLERHGLAAVIVTRGSEGAAVVTEDVTLEVPSFQVAAVDATGAGDGFVAGVLAGLVRLDDGTPMAEQVRGMSEAGWREVLTRACAVGAIATTRPGAIEALPTLAALESFLRR
jgi:sugar/nucleoside kinase (ribokinase family)